MALPPESRNTFSPAEIEFIAENDIIKIVPSIRMDELRLMNKTYGPFNPPIGVDVPLWLALLLKKSGKCRIEIPGWMEADALRQSVENEKMMEGFLVMPFHYVEIGHMLITHASDDIPSLSVVIEAFKVLRDLRQYKMQRGLKLMKPDIGALAMDGLSLMEINEIRPVFSKAYDEIRRLGEIISKDR
ncbi:DNA replication protein psf2 [Irineochytrium annulatum]|nr:DNA replication protein psf2 [Irineochytrium annulatum]